MAEDFLSSFIGNPNKARMVRVFVMNQSSKFTQAQIAKKAGISLGVVAREIKVLKDMGIIKKGKLEAVKRTSEIPRHKRERASLHSKKSKPVWQFDEKFKHARAVSSFVHEVSPIRYNNIVAALKNSGRLATVVVSGSFMGDPSRPADLIVAADTINESRLERAIHRLESVFGREIRYAAFSIEEFRYRLTIQDRLIRDTLDFPHLVLMDRKRLLK